MQIHLKHFNRHLECIDVSFNPENGANSTIKKQTDRQSDYCNPLAHARLPKNFALAYLKDSIIYNFVPTQKLHLKSREQTTVTNYLSYLLHLECLCTSLMLPHRTSLCNALISPHFRGVRRDLCGSVLLNVSSSPTTTGATFTLNPRYCLAGQMSHQLLFFLCSRSSQAHADSKIIIF